MLHLRTSLHKARALSGARKQLPVGITVYVQVSTFDATPHRAHK